MIKNKVDYLYYLECDKVALGVNSKKPRPFTDYVWKYQILLRKLEYYVNCKPFPGILNNLIITCIKIRFNKLSVLLGFDIPINVVGPGLCIVHPGTVVISEGAIIGKNLRIHEGVTIGATNMSSKAAIIGDNVFIGSGAKIIGEVTIGNNVAIAAGAVVITDLPSGTFGGVPCKKISDNNSSLNLIPSTNIVDTYFWNNKTIR